VIGPKELPAVLRTVGQWMGKMRRMAAEFQGQFQDAMREAEMADLKKTFDETTSGLTSVFDPVKNDIDNLVKDPMSAGVSDATAPVPDPAAPVPDAVADISVPMPEMPPPVETADFAPGPVTPAPDLAQADAPGTPAPEAGGGKAA
jgi:sec-independent protein translocase protein TatB